MEVLRRNSGLTAQNVARQLDVAESTVRNWDKGRTEPSLKMWQVKALTEMYGCDLDDLVSAVKESRGKYEESQ